MQAAGAQLCGLDPALVKAPDLEFSSGQVWPVWRASGKRHHLQTLEAPKPGGVAAAGLCCRAATNRSWSRCYARSPRSQSFRRPNGEVGGGEGAGGRHGCRPADLCGAVTPWMAVARRTGRPAPHPLQPVIGTVGEDVRMACKSGEWLRPRGTSGHCGRRPPHPGGTPPAGLSALRP